MNKNLFAPLAAAFFILIYLTQSAVIARTYSTASDEVAHIAAGYSYVKFRDFKINPEHPPLLKQMAALPLMFMNLKFPSDIPAWKDGQGEQWELGRTFLFKDGNPAMKIISAARTALLPLAVLLCLVLFFWVRELFGPAAAVFSVFTAAFIPDLIVHSSLVTTDFGGAVFHFMTFYFLYRFHKTGYSSFLLGAGIAGGLALISKFSMMQILPLYYAAALFIAFDSRSALPSLRFPVWLLGLITLFAVTEKLTLQVFAVPVLYFWGYAFFPKNKFFQNRRVHTAMGILLALLALSFLVVVADYFEPAYLFPKFRPLRRFCRGWSIFRDHAVQLQHPGYFFGKTSSSGWREYYVMAMLVKIPLPVWIFAAAGLIAAIKRKWTCKAEWFFLVLPPAFFLFIASVINKVNIGVRHVLPVYPYLIVLAAAGFYGITQIKNKSVSFALTAALSVWLCITSLSAFPNDLSYFNELARLWGGGEKILSDSNISWGQDVLQLNKYIEKNHIREIKTQMIFNFPEELDYYKLPWKDGEDDLRNHKPGIYAIDVFNYQRLILQPQYAWLKNSKPDAKVGGSILIYKL